MDHRLNRLSSLRNGKSGRGGVSIHVIIKHMTHIIMEDTQECVFGYI